MDKMEGHARQCNNLTPERFGSNLRKDIIDELARVKSNKENIPASNPQTRLNTPQSFSEFCSHIPTPLQNSNTGRPLKRKMTAETAIDDVYNMWTQSQQADFGADFCRMLIANNISWNTANNPETHIFFDKYLPQAHIPDCRVLGGRILDGVVRDVEDETKHRIGGKVGTGQCDGWKNIAKSSVITSMMTVDNEVSTVSLSIWQTYS